MPIIGLTDSIEPRYRTIGKLRKGDEKDPNSNRPGEDLDHWRFTSDDPEVEQAFYDAYGHEPKLVNVFIPYDTPADAFPNWCEVWGKSGLIHRCDGKEMSVWQEGSKYMRGKKPCMGGHKDNDPLKDAIGRLSVVIPELVMAGFVGYVAMETHGKNDILNISRVLEATYQSKGTLRGIGFVLRRQLESISVPGYGKSAGGRTRADKWLVILDPAAEWMRLQMDMNRNQAALESGETKQLPAGKQEQPAPPAPDTAANNDTLDSLGVQLWLSRWDDVKAKLLTSKTNDPLKFVSERFDKLSDPAVFRDHLEKGWPKLVGYESLLKRLPEGCHYKFLMAVDAAWNSKHLDNSLDENAIIGIIENSMELEGSPLIPF
jgi:hypothetical protein